MLVFSSSSSSIPPLFNTSILLSSIVISSSSSSSSNNNNNNMDFSDLNPTGRSPRRELQGPRPAPLRINKDSHKIKKPPLAPQPSQPHQPPPRQPVIIYTVSPKIIHTTPGDFMSLVQRLTGSSSSSSASSTSYPTSYTSSTAFPSSSASDVVPSNDPFNGDNAAGMLSPAARYATIEKARSPVGKKMQNHPMNGDQITSDVEGVEMMMGHGVMERTSMFQGILSPGPASLSPIPSSFFSPPSSDPSMVSFLHDLSPMFHSNRSNFMDGIGGGFIMPSPSNFVSPHTPSIDLFNYFLD